MDGSYSVDRPSNRRPVTVRRSVIPSFRPSVPACNCPPNSVNFQDDASGPTGPRLPESGRFGPRSPARRAVFLGPNGHGKTSSARAALLPGPVPVIPRRGGPGRGLLGWAGLPGDAGDGDGRRARAK